APGASFCRIASQGDVGKSARALVENRPAHARSATTALRTGTPPREPTAQRQIAQRQGSCRKAAQPARHVEKTEGGTSRLSGDCRAVSFDRNVAGNRRQAVRSVPEIVLYRQRIDSVLEVDRVRADRVVG